MDAHPLIVGNRRVAAAPGGVITVNNPFDGAAVAQAPLGDKSLLDQAAAAAQDAFASTSRRMAPFQRAKILGAAAEALRGRRSEFAATIVAEAGKPITLAEAEVDRAVNTFTAAAEEARRWQGEVLDLDGFASGAGHVGLTRRFPLGVIYGITPFNFPLNLVAHKVAPAIATGNAIVIKPSPRTPLCAIKLVRLLLEAGAPAGLVNVVTCANELAGYLIDDPRIRHVSFTGSAAVGWQIKRRAAPTQRVTLELGGNAALIIHDDADLDAAVVAAASGAFGYAGQSCISVQRIMVQQRVYDRFCAMLVEHMGRHVRCGDPRDRATLVGPMIDAAALQRAQSAIDQAVQAGAKLLIGGETVGPCLAPTLLENVDMKSPICQSEIFAPVATLHRYQNFAQSLEMANDTPYGLQAGIFTRDLSHAWQAFESLEVGAVLINQAPTWRVETMPYGGVKQSGFGREGIRYAMQDMTEPRTLVMRLGD